MISNRPALRWLAGLGLVVALTMPAGTASAAPSSHEADHQVHINCGLLRTDGAAALVNASVSAADGPSANLMIWYSPADPEIDLPDLVAGAVDLVAAGDASSLTGTVELLDFDLGEPVGTATFDATLTPLGAPETTEVFGKDGNRKSRFVQTIQHLDVSGTLAVTGATSEHTFSLDDCSGDASDQAHFSNEPSSTVAAAQVLALRCLWELDGVSARLQAETDASASFADLAVLTPERTFLGSDDATTFTHESFAASFVNAAGITDGDAATVSAALTPQDRVTWTIQEQNTQTRFSGIPLHVDGKVLVTFGDGTQIDLPMTDEACQAIDRTGRQVKSSNEGSNLSVPANDLPDAAAPIGHGGRASVHTGGAAPEGEMPTACLSLDTPEGPLAFPPSHSVWYRVVGSGEPVTIRTAGSDFDTVVAVYAVAGDELSEIGCNDDVPLAWPAATRQSALTFQAEAGVTYLVQAGGYFGQSGHLRLDVD